MTSRYYLDDNLIDNKPAGWEKVIYDSGTATRNGEHYTKDPKHYNGSQVEYVNISGTDYVRIPMDDPAPTGEVTTHTAKQAYEKVLTYAGASLHQDNVDERYFREARTGTAEYKGSVTKKAGRIDKVYKGSVTKKAGRIDKVSDCKGYTEANFPTGKREAGFDTDNDGIPDEWEEANGLNPNDASDAKLYTIDTEKKWYTNLEVYANSLVESIMKAGNADAESAVDEYYPAWQVPAGIVTLHPSTFTLHQKTYNLRGQLVGDDYKGIVVRNGKKYYQQ